MTATKANGAATRGKPNGAAKRTGIAFRANTAKTSTTAKTKAKKATPIPMFNVNMGVEEQIEYFNIMIYGPPGAGKTTTAATVVDMPNMRDVFFVNSDEGMPSIRTSGVVEHHSDLAHTKVSTVEELDTLARFFKQYCDKRDADDEEWLERYAEAYGWPPEARFRTIIMDTFSEIGKINLDRLTDGGGEEEISFTSDATPDFKANRPQIQRILRRFRNMRMNVIMTCHADEFADESKRLNYRPKLTGKLATDIFETQDAAIFMVREKSADGVRRPTMCLESGKRAGRFFEAKSRITPPEIDVIEEATMPRLWEHVEEAKIGKRHE